VAVRAFGIAEIFVERLQVSRWLLLVVGDSHRLTISLSNQPKNQILLRRNVMQLNSMMKVVLAVVLCVSLATTGCTAEWIKVALADLPVLTQMALNIASLVAALEAGKQVSPTEAAAIQNISAEAGKDLNLLQALYSQYKVNPDKTTLAKIQSVIGDINQNLPALLQAAHISNPTLLARVTAAVSLILSTVTSFASLMPQPATPSIAARRAPANTAVPHAKDLKKRWNAQVCTPTGNAAFDAGLTGCSIK
jgi:hypothetical protein